VRALLWEICISPLYSLTATGLEPEVVLLVEFILELSFIQLELRYNYTGASQAIVCAGSPTVLELVNAPLL